MHIILIMRIRFTFFRDLCQEKKRLTTLGQPQTQNIYLPLRGNFQSLSSLPAAIQIHYHSQQDPFIYIHLIPEQHTYKNSLHINFRTYSISTIQDKGFPIPCNSYKISYLHPFATDFDAKTYHFPFNSSLQTSGHMRFYGFI